MDNSLTGIAARMADCQLTPVRTEPVTHTYWVGDLCYVLNSDQWSTVCYHDFGLDSDGDYDPEGFLEPENLTFDEESYPAAKPFYIFRTAYGDGCYNDKEGNPYCVDSGTIGCIRTEYADPEKLADAVARGLGHLHEFDDEFGISQCGEDEGTIWFYTGSKEIEIETGGSCDWEEDEEDDDEEYDNE